MSDAVLTTPSPYLRDRLLAAATGLRKDAETARLNLAAAEQEVAEARELLAETEAQRNRARHEADILARDIAWLERQAARRTAEIDARPDQRLAATGLMVEPPKQVDPAPVSAEIYQDNGLPMAWSNEAAPGGYVCAVLAPPDGPGIDMSDGTRVCGMPVESEPCGEHGPDGVPPVPRAVGDAPDAVPPVNIARPGVSVTAPPVPHDPAGQVVATGGPTTTMPDLGPKREPLDPPPGEGTHSHAKPADGLMSRVTGGFKALIHHDDEQDGDA